MKASFLLTLLPLLACVVRGIPSQRKFTPLHIWQLSNDYDALARAADGPHDEMYHYLRERVAEAAPGDDVNHNLRERAAEAVPGDDQYYALRERAAEAVPGDDQYYALRERAAEAEPGDDQYYAL